MFFTVVRPEWKANHDYVQGRCMVLNKRLAEKSDDDGTTYRPELLVRYTAGGREFQEWAYDAARVFSGGRAGRQAELDGFTVGQQYPCWYDPDDPAQVVLVRGHSWSSYAALIAPLIFVAVGGGGVYYSLTWRKRRAARLETAYARQLRDAAGRPEGGGYPAVPDRPEALPGTALAFRLPRGDAAAAKLVAAGCGLVVCVSMAAGCGGVAVALGSNPPTSALGMLCFGGTAVLLLFGAVLLLWQLGKQAVVYAKVRPTEVEVSAHPLYVGETARLLVRQPGPLRLLTLEVLLVCEEEASYTQGTDRRTEKKCVFRRALARAKDVEAGADQPYEAGCDLEVPAGMMHSFRSKNNEVKWTLLVRGGPVGLPDFERDYPLVVRPPRVPAEGQP
jgi:hypothetical protein